MSSGVRKTSQHQNPAEKCSLPCGFPGWLHTTSISHSSVMGRPSLMQEHSAAALEIGLMRDFILWQATRFCVEVINETRQWLFSKLLKL